MLGTALGNGNKAVNKWPILKIIIWGWETKNQYKMLDAISTMEEKIKQGKRICVEM